MPASHSYFGQNHVTYRDPVINESSLGSDDHFHQRDRSMQKNKHKVIKQVYRVKRDGRLNKNPDLTQEIEKPTTEKISATPVDQIVPNRNLASSDIAEQETRSAVGQDQKKSAGSTKTGQIGHKIGPTGPSCNFGNSPKITTRKKPSFEELLHKYQRIAAEKKIDRLEGKQRRSYSSSRAKRNQHHWGSSHWSSSFFIPLMHMPWNAYSGITNHSPWFCYNP